MGAGRSVETALRAVIESDAASVPFIDTTAAVETFMGTTSYNAPKAASPSASISERVSLTPYA